MTISATGNRYSYAGNGTTTVFSFPREFVAATDLDVYLVDNATDTAVLQAIVTHYTVAGAGSPTGGTVTMNVAPPAGKTLVIVRDTALTQGLDLDNASAVNLEALENALDRAMLTIDEINTKVSRAVQPPIYSDKTFDYTLPTPVANKVLGVNLSGTGFEFVTGGSGGGLGGPTGPTGPAGPTGPTGPAGPSVWGGITGTLSTQTDLQTALDAKQASSAELTGLAGLSSTGFVKRTGAGTYALDSSTYLASTALGTTVQAWDADLDAIAALAGTSGVLKKTAANTWALQSAVAVADGGTGATTAPAALTALTGYLSITSSAGTTTLTNTSPRTVIVTGSTTHTIVLPDVTTLALGWTFEIVNANSAGVVTVQSSGLNAFSNTHSAQQVAQYTCVAITGTGVASWVQRFTGATGKTGTGAVAYQFSPLLQQVHFSNSNAVTAGTNAQGQGVLSETVNLITTAANNPSGVTLSAPAGAAQTKMYVIVNKGANPVNVYPQTGGTIDALAANAAISLPVNGVVHLYSTSTTQWYSSLNNARQSVNGIFSTGTAGIGYATGAGGTVTQLTSRTTGVTLNKITGAITLFSSTTTAGTFSNFVVTNSTVAATDAVIVNFVSATTAASYSVIVSAVAAGNFTIQVHNIAAVAVAEAPVIRFAVIKAVSA